MKVETTKIYRCEHCRKYYSVSAGATNYHEKICSQNPLNRHKCFGCEHLELVFTDTNGGTDGEIKVKTLKCKAKNVIMHSNKTAERVKRNYPNLKTVGELMPYECDQFEYKF